MTQTDRVLASLKRAGERGVTAADWSGVRDTPDGGPPIPRFAARVMELRSMGHRVEPRGWRDRCRVQVLVPALERPAPVEQGSDGLFDPPPSPGRLGAYDDRWAS